MTTVAAALFVDLGEGRETGHGTFRWSRLPRARYECLRCHTVETPDGNGPGDIARFISSIRDQHTCRTTRQAQAA
ncbi:hypothetical protein [Streptomyces sp. L2]|uniref:hypothetical protein n=1 Tax=Streptomyces sp. L2 TaxID=2162665 RepID=UPI001012D464|nr:hypothetical protein [Streptomyces sp. L2]